MSTSPSRAGYGPALAITVALGAAAWLALMSVALLVIHPPSRLGAVGVIVIRQNQTAKTLLYVAAFAIVLPGAVLLAGRLADRIAAGPNAPALAFLAAVLLAGLALILILARLSSRLPWGDGLGPVLGATVLWWLAAAAGLWRAAQPRPWPALLELAGRAPAAAATAGTLLFVLLLGLTRPTSLHPVPLVLGGLAVASLVAFPSRRLPPLRPRIGLGLELLFVLVLALAIPNVVVFHTARTLSPYLPPALLADQQNYLLGSANQLLGGGALLVNVPVSQYGVGLIYFLDLWFHLVPIGYGTAGALDGILTALFYIAAYAALRIAGAGRLLAVAAIGVGLLGLVYSLFYGVGALPETGPLRFGLPMALVLAAVIEARRPLAVIEARRPLARLTPAAALGVLGLSSVWAFEAFAYTALTFLAISAVQAWLLAPGGRRRWLTRRLALGAGVCLAAHLSLALGTLLVTGRLPDWGQYFAYLSSFLLGGRAGIISYGFSDWSPGLAVAGAIFASAAGVLLLLRRAPDLARSAPATLVGLAGATAYAVGLFSYADNRSATSLLPYVTLPVLMATVLWLALVLRHGSALLARGALALASATGALLISSAWPSIGHNFSESALAHARPGGGLGAAVHRLWHPPPIDPRALVGAELLARYVRGHRVLVLLPLDPDLGVEILMRAGRVNSLFIGDPVDDSLVPSLWMSKLPEEVAGLRAGQRLLINRGTEQVLAQLRVHPGADLKDHPLDAGTPDLEWVLRALSRRFAIVPVHSGPRGMIVARLATRGG